jgi:hypothetical protein
MPGMLPAEPASCNYLIGDSGAGVAELGRGAAGSSTTSIGTDLPVRARGRMEGGGTFGVDGLRDALDSTADPTAAPTAMAIQQAVTDCWREPLEDDGTVVVMAVG